jgi:phage gp16-like protein
MPSKANLAKIHIGKKELNLADENYRDILYALAKKESAADISDRQALAVLERFRELGWKPKQARKKGRRPTNMDRGDSRSEQLGKIEALLTIGGLSWAYADAIARQMRLADAVQFVATKDLFRIITALRRKAQKEGWDLSGEKK